MVTKILTSACIILFTQLSIAALDENIFIQGKVGNEFDDQKVKVTDSHDQKYWLPRSAFPKGFKFKEGALFNIEVSEAVANTVFVKK